MRVTNVRINGMLNPVGFLMDDVRVSWKVTETEAKKQKNVKIEAALDEGFTSVVYMKEGRDLNPAAELLEIELTAYTCYFVRVTVTGDNGDTATSQTAYFETGKMDQPWTAEWITTQQNDEFHPIFFKSFKSGKEIKKARLYICGLGLFKAYLNGENVGEEVLTPYYSNYHDEEQYLTFDITKGIKKENKIEVSLGDGWYKGRFGLAGKINNFGSEFKLIAEIHLEYTDGEKEVIGTDESWNYIGSDIESDSIYDGEVVNHLLWDGKDNAVKSAVRTTAEGKLTARYSLPIYEMEDMSVKEVIHTPAGETVLDFGQNFAGYVTFKASFPKGTKIVLDFGEILQNDNFYNENYRSAKAQFVYVSDGRAEEVKPIFTYFGFRYVRVTGWTEEVNKEDFIGKAVYSGMETTGHIETGHKGVNQLFSNTMWGLKSNFVDIPTDCPQRDEKLGWSGDAQVFCGTASYNMNTAAFYNKFLHDLRTEQIKAGGIAPGVIPVFVPQAVLASSVWSDVATIIPTVLYEHFADKYALKEHYPIMKDWVDWITNHDIERGQKYLYDFGEHLGDWLALDGRTSQSMEGGTDTHFIGSCYYLMSVKKVADAAEALGYGEDEAYYRDLYAKIHDAIIKEYYTASGRLALDTQTAYLVALFAEVYVDKDIIIKAFKDRLFKDCYKLKGGFVGAPIMCRVMAENGMADEAFYFLMQRGFPGWMHCIDLGATTIWERWNSVLDNGLLSGTMMNSLNHYAYGSIVEYLYRDVAGIKALEPGFKKALITPQMNGNMKYMKMSYDSVYGVYRSEWSIKEDGMVHIEIEVPFGCSAVIELPLNDGKRIEVEAGVYTYDYRPTANLLSRYTESTIFKDMMEDKEAMAVIESVSPMLNHFLTTGNEDYYYENLKTLKRLTFMGFKEDEIDKLGKELAALRN